MRIRSSAEPLGDRGAAAASTSMAITRPRSPAKLGLMIGATVAATIFAFAPAFDAGFILADDPEYVVQNPMVQQGLTLEALLWSLRDFEASYWHPVTWWSHMLDWELFGPNPRGHHLSSVVIHAMTAGILLLALSRLTGSPWRSTIVALIFALHPLRVESVVWVAERKDVLSGFFFALVLLAYAGRRSMTRRITLVSLALALGLAAKPMLVSVPFVLLLLDMWPRGVLLEDAFRNRAHRRIDWLAARVAILEKTPLFLLSLASCVLTLRSADTAIKPLAALSMEGRVANASLAVASYVRSFFWPTGLAPFYPLETTVSAATLLSAMAVVVTSVGALFLFSRAPYLAVGWYWFLVMLTPVVGIVQAGTQGRADRFTYLPSIGLAIALVWGAGEVTAAHPRARKLALAVGAVCLVAATLATRAQARLWIDGISVMQRAVEQSPQSGYARALLGGALARAGYFEEAEPHLEAATQLEPNMWRAHVMLAQVRVDLERYESGIASASEALRLQPNSPVGLRALARALRGRGQEEAAAQVLLRALAIDADDLQTYLLLADLIAANDQVPWDHLLNQALTEHPESGVLVALGAALAESYRDGSTADRLHAASSGLGELSPRASAGIAFLSGTIERVAQRDRHGGD